MLTPEQIAKIKTAQAEVKELQDKTNRIFDSLLRDLELDPLEPRDYLTSQPVKNSFDYQYQNAIETLFDVLFNTETDELDEAITTFDERLTRAIQTHQIELDDIEAELAK